METADIYSMKGSSHDFGPTPVTPKRILAARLAVKTAARLGMPEDPWMQALADHALPDHEIEANRLPKNTREVSATARDAVNVVLLFDPDDCGYDGPVTRAEFDAARDRLRVWCQN